MVRVIMGVKGTGKTKQMIELINSAVHSENGNVVCIERGPKLTYDIHYKIRLVEASHFDVSSFDFMKSIEILVMVVLGGMGSMLGSILSATVLTILPEALRSVADYRMVLYSIVLILMMIFRPGGLLGSYDFSLSRIISKVLSHGGKEETTHE